MKKSGVFWTIALLLTLLAAGCSSAKPNTENVVAVGHVAALSGDLALWGQAEKNALTLTVEKINAAGGVAGKQLKIISYDTRGDAAETAKAAQRLLVHDRVVAIIGPAQSSNAIVMSAVTEPAKIPFIATAATSPKATFDPVANTVRGYAFRAGFVDSYQGSVAAQFAGRELKAKSAAVVYDAGSEYSTVLAAFFVKQFVKQGGKVLANEAFRANDTDFRPLLTKVDQDEPAVIFVPTLHKEAALLVKQARGLGMKAKIIGGDGWSNPEILTLGGAALEGTYFIAQTGLGDPAIGSFVAEYRSKFGQDPVLPNAMLAVDGLMMLIEAIKKADGTDPVKIARQLATLKDTQVLTGRLSIDPLTNSPQNRSAVVQEIRGGQFVYRTKIAAD